MPQYEPLLDAAETGGGASTGEDEVSSAGSVASGGIVDNYFSPEEKEKRLAALLGDALTGDLARGRSLKYWENLKLKPQHIQILIMKAAGYNNRMIAKQMGLTESRVSILVNHPDSLTILSRLVSFQAENLLDIKARIQAHAGEALDTALYLMRNSENQAVRAKAAFSLLDRAGYGAVQKVEATHRLEMPAEQARDLTKVLAEAREVEDADWEIEEEVPIVVPGTPDSSSLPESSAGGSGVPGVATPLAAVPPSGGQSELPRLRRTA